MKHIEDWLKHLSTKALVKFKYDPIMVEVGEILRDQVKKVVHQENNTIVVYVDSTKSRATLIRNWGQLNRWMRTLLGTEKTLYFEVYEEKNDEE